MVLKKGVNKSSFIISLFKNDIKIYIKKNLISSTVCSFWFVILMIHLFVYIFRTIVWYKTIVFAHILSFNQNIVNRLCNKVASICKNINFRWKFKKIQSWAYRALPEWPFRKRYRLHPIANQKYVNTFHNYMKINVNTIQ